MCDKRIMRFVFASNNSHKLSEVRQIMPSGIEILSLREIGFASEIDETGTTLEANSRIKADAVYSYIRSEVASGHSVLSDIDGVFADDTGLEIDALCGQPGVYTARWSGCSGTEQEVFAANRAKALHELSGCVNRGAQFRTVITLITMNGSEEQVRQVEGVVRGCIADAERGEGGFGYDPLFIPEGYNQTFAELPIRVKNTISHRARAMEALKALLDKQ